MHMNYASNTCQKTIPLFKIKVPNIRGKKKKHLINSAPLVKNPDNSN